MLQQNFYPGKAIQIWGGGDGGSDDANIPNPSYHVIELDGTTTSGINGNLVDASATFIDDLNANKFAIGDTVYQNRTYKYSTIVSVVSQTELVVFDVTFFPAVFAATDYQIYRKSPIGCIVWVHNDRDTNNPVFTVSDMNDTSHTITRTAQISIIIPFQCQKFYNTNGPAGVGQWAFAMFQ